MALDFQNLSGGQDESLVHVQGSLVRWFPWILFCIEKIANSEGENGIVLSEGICPNRVIWTRAG